MTNDVRIVGGSLKYSHREKRRFRSDKDWWEVDDPYHLYAEEGHCEIESGFLTDGASVPRPLWRLMPPMSDYTRVAVPHDWFYRHKGVFKWRAWDDNQDFDEALPPLVEKKITRARADELFRDGMIYLDVTAWKIPVMYAGVRAGGPRW